MRFVSVVEGRGREDGQRSAGSSLARTDAKVHLTKESPLEDLLEARLVVQLLYYYYYYLFN